MIETIYEKVRSHKRISDAEALWLWHYGSDELLKDLASTVKERFHRSNEATYLIMAIINYTNICVAGCDYCAFYRMPHHKEAYLLSEQQVKNKIEKLRFLGGTLAGFNGGFNPLLSLSDFANFFRSIKASFPDMTFYDMTVAEFMFYCKKDKISYEKGADLMKSSGVNWITGGGAEILSENFRARHSKAKYTVSDYFTAQKAILDAQIGSTATMVIGFDETIEERMDHLSALRQFQDKSAKALSSFLCWTYKPWNNQLGGQEISTEAYLRWLSICRIYLDNFQHIRTSVLTKNEDALKGILYGANDFDLPIEDEVTEKAGARVSLDFDHILQTAKNLGIEVKHRKPWQVPAFGKTYLISDQTHEHHLSHYPSGTYPCYLD